MILKFLPSLQPKDPRRPNKTPIMEKNLSNRSNPRWHPPWKVSRVIPDAHQGCIRSMAFDPSHSWFATGSADCTIRIWDAATCELKLTLTGHMGQVRALAVSARSIYMYSAGDDKLVKCWDVEQNKVVQSYQGHLSSVYCLSLHPDNKYLMTGSRDCVCRVWDVRTRDQALVLSGHKDTISSVFTLPTRLDTQVVTGSHDADIRFWDLRSNSSVLTLEFHKKSVRAMALHPFEDCFAFASTDNIKKFSLLKRDFLQNMISDQRILTNSMAINDEDVMVTGGDNGNLYFWNWEKGYIFQHAQTIQQPNSLDSEAGSGIYALSFDITGQRLLTCGAKTITMWKQDVHANPQAHPLRLEALNQIGQF